MIVLSLDNIYCDSLTTWRLTVGEYVGGISQGSFGFVGCRLPSYSSILRKTPIYRPCLVAPPDGSRFESNSCRSDLLVDFHHGIVQIDRRELLCTDLLLSKEYPGEFEVAYPSSLLSYVRRVKGSSQHSQTNGKVNGLATKKMQ